MKKMTNKTLSRDCVIDQFHRCTAIMAGLLPVRCLWDAESIPHFIYRKPFVKQILHFKFYTQLKINQCCVLKRKSRSFCFMQSRHLLSWQSGNWGNIHVIRTWQHRAHTLEICHYQHANNTSFTDKRQFAFISKNSWVYFVFPKHNFIFIFSEGESILQTL